VPLQLSDALTFQSTPPNSDGSPGRIEFRVVDARPPGDHPLPTGADNLVVRALELLRSRSGSQLGACVELVKRIPVAAGLGGGSSDAAAALRVANRQWRIDWPLERLAALAAELGSDVPFFLGHGAAICRGRGEQVERLSGTVPLDLVLVKPPAGLQTVDVYRRWDERLRGESRPPACGPIEALVAALRRGTLKNLGQWMANELEAAAGSLSPWIERARDAFSRLDFLGHQLSGSGTTYFGVCRHARHARRLATILRARQLGLVWVTRSCR
jgi:4-diphosphocytidyl-2-C-methyl-D-erythritol kinase